MLFSSPLFIFIFLPATLTLFFLLPKKIRYFALLFANLIFYAFGEQFYLFAFLFFILANFIFALAIDAYNKKDRKNKAKIIFIISIILNLSFLIFFKYSAFLVQNFNLILSLIQIPQIPLPNNIHLPLGISFYTFQGISYLIDVYRGNLSATKNLFNFALFQSFFPQLIAGPIIRYKDVADQFKDKKNVEARDFSYGIERFILGLAKKIIIADTIAILVDQIFLISPTQLTASAAWLGTLAYAVQIYFDFSGYSDMAIGMGRMFGFKFKENFNYPYIATSVRDFWRRWHISLTSWFRDYLYISLGGNRISKNRTYLNLIIVFFLCGLWHGPSWTFIIWGAWHGIFLALERTKFGRILKRLPALISNLFTLFIVLIGWVLFRSETFPKALLYLKSMFLFNQNTPASYTANYFINGEILTILLIAIVASTPIPNRIIQKLSRFKSKNPAVNFLQKYLFSPIFVILVASIFVITLSYLSGSTRNPFIYFRF